MNISVKKSNELFDLIHLPSWLLIIGYPLFWIELFVFDTKDGTTSPWALFVFFLVSLYFFIRDFHHLKDFFAGVSKEIKDNDLLSKCLLISSGVIILLILLLVFYVASLPPHLPQEFDTINYHLTLPRQHLIRGSFDHISWATNDLFILPIDFALSVFWCVTPLPNKYPQLIFFLGMVFVMTSLTYQLSGKKILNAIVIFIALFASHHVGIQMGTAMLDLVICYLFFAALDSLMKGRMFLFFVEFTFYLWSKPLMPALFFVVFIVLFVLYKILNRTLQFSCQWDFRDNLKIGLEQKLGKIFLGIIVFSLIVAGPFLVKSTYYAGTPLFPIGTGTFIINENIDKGSEHWISIKEASDYFMKGSTDQYGHGRSPIAFIKHFWLMAVPEKGVNNSYDYPLGLIYLLVVVPFFEMFIQSFKQKKFVLLLLFLTLFWFFWWFGSQQTRYIFVPILLMVMLVIASFEKPSKVFISIVFVALLLTSISLFRAHKNDLGKSKEDVLRTKDKNILILNELYLSKGQRGEIDLSYPDCAFAQFPVRVPHKCLPHVLALNKQ